MTVCIKPETTAPQQRLSKGANTSSAVIVPHHRENRAYDQRWALHTAIQPGKGMKMLQVKPEGGAGVVEW